MKELNNCQTSYNSLRYITFIFIINYNLFQYWELTKELIRETGKQAVDDAKKITDAILVSNTNSL